MQLDISDTYSHNFDDSGIVLFRARHDSNNGNGSPQLFIQRYKVSGGG